MDPDLKKRIEAVASDRESGASEILLAAIAILRDAIAARANLEAVAAGLQRAQPAMAPIWNATAAALKGDLERFAQRVARAPAAIERFACSLLETGASPDLPLRIATLSYSGTVAAVLEALAKRRPVEVACSEGRPALEGRRLASRLAGNGIPVTFYSDAAIGESLGTVTAVVIGADAVAAEWFLNKAGTRMLVALAAQRGVPTYVLAGREKFIGPSTAARLEIPERSPAELWRDPPNEVTVRNVYFERTPLELIAAVVCDSGVLTSSDVAEAIT